MPGRAIAGVVLGCVAVLAACQEADSECLTVAASTRPGELVWEEAFTAKSGDSGRAIAVDRCSGRVAVGGAIDAHDIVGSDIWLGALSHDGEPIWDRAIHEKFSEHVSALAFDGDGSLLVAGTTDLGPYTGSNHRAGWLGRFDEEFAEQWRVHGLADDEDDSLRFGPLALAGDGRMFLAGRRATKFDPAGVAFAEARDPEGALLWRHDHGGEDGSTRIDDILVLPDGDVVLVGSSRSLGAEPEPALLVLRLTADGETVSEQRWTELPGSGRSAALSADGGSIMVVTGGWLGELALDGALRREAWLADAHHPHDVAVGVEGDVYVVGRQGMEFITGIPDFGVGKPWVTRFDRDLVPVWEHVLDREGEANAVQVGPTGDAFVIGTVMSPPPAPTISDNRDIWIARFAR